jgi:hypothetical protein
MLGNRVAAVARRARPAVAWVAALGLAAVAAGPALAQENSDCLACDGEKDFRGERRGRTVSLFVSEKAFSGSMHGGLSA